jgi:hypothetical protein
MGKERCKERDIAMSKNEDTYFTGKPCKHGHICPRKVRSSECVRCREIINLSNLKNSARQKAIREGKNSYSTGKPCRRGHISDRDVISCQCIECRKTLYRVTAKDAYRSAKNTLSRQLQLRKTAAIRSGIPFSVTIDDIEQPELCPVLGIKLDYGCSDINKRNPAKATIDKVIPALGYIKGNVYIISHRANRLKSDVTLTELEQLLEYVRRNSNG